MPINYIIAIGGTGARCLESVVYLAAMGLFENPLHLLMIDPDQDNGNVNRTRKVIPMYHELQRCVQPQGAKQGGIGFGSWDLQPPVLFGAPINFDEKNPSLQHPFFWQDPNS